MCENPAPKWPFAKSPTLLRSLGIARCVFLDRRRARSVGKATISTVCVSASGLVDTCDRLSVVGILAGLAKLLLAIVRVGSAHLFASDRTVAALDSNTDLHASLRSDFLCRRQASTFVGSGM